MYSKASMCYLIHDTSAVLSMMLTSDGIASTERDLLLFWTGCQDLRHHANARSSDLQSGTGG